MGSSLFWRAVFAAALCFAVVMASLPHPPTLPGEPQDKLQHIAAFAVLTLLATLGWPRQRAWRIALALSLVGVAIELIQMIPALHRDAEFADWAADTAAILVTLLLMQGWRRISAGVQSS